MKPLDKTPDLLERLQTFEDFQDIDPEALQWMIEQSDYMALDSGETLYQPGEPVDYMLVIMEGEFVIRVERDGDIREIASWGRGYVMGVLPFSRMTHTQAWWQATKPSTVLRLHRRYFTEMVDISYSLTQALVATMSNRIRDYTTHLAQSEKLMALGRLSAGLAHELNNPASAMVRSADELYQKIHSTPEKFKNVITMRVTPEETDAINAIIFSKIETAKELDLTLLEREARMDDLIDWLEDRDSEHAEDIAETFVDFGITPGELDRVEEILGGKSVPTILWWIESTLSLEKLVHEIREAADRISTLVTSVKSYSYMDRSKDRERIDVHEGLRNTLIMLQHKFKKGQVKLEKQLDKSLPSLSAFPGELNQVWTNLIANALDAMPDGGVLTVRTYKRRDFLCVDIEDTGTGISQEDLSRIFEPFYTTKKLGEGTGMGLDIVKRILNRHNAEIQVESQPGQTVFTVCFPMQAVGVERAS